MSSLLIIRAANAAWSFPSHPVALFVGETSGVGRDTIQAFERHTQGNADIIICGRNRAAAESIFNSLPSGDASAGAIREFMPYDVSLMKNIHATTSSILERLPKLNHLFVSTGYLAMNGSDATEEGIERKLAVHYYSRFAFTDDLIPLLEKAAAAGEDAKVVTMLSARNRTGNVDLDNLGLKTCAYCTPGACISSSIHRIYAHRARRCPYTCPQQHDGIIAQHVRPVLNALMYPISVSEEMCGEHMLYALLQGKPCAWRRGPKGDDIGRKGWTGTEEEQKAVWEHFVQIASVGS